MQVDRTESSYLWQAMSESTVTGTARPAMQSWPWKRVQPSTASPTLLARRSRQWLRAWWPATAPRSWGRRTTAGLGSHTRKTWSLSCWFWEQKSVKINLDSPTPIRVMAIRKGVFLSEMMMMITPKHYKGWMIWMKHFTIYTLFIGPEVAPS